MRITSPRARRLTSAAVAAALAMAAAGCTTRDSSPSDTLEVSESVDTAPTDASNPVIPSETLPRSTAGDFGSIQQLCRPGDASGATDRGVTDDTITIGVTADPGNPIIPGLGAEFFTAASAFATWCNAAGGINGRTIVVNERDAGLFNTAGVFLEACETDFMLVGNGNALDDAGVGTRVGCELGQIPAYQTSVSASESALQVQPMATPIDEWQVGGYRAVEAVYPGVLAAAGIVGSDQPTQERNNLGPKAGIEALGGTVLDIQRVPGIPDNWRPFAEAQKAAGVQLLLPGAAAIGYMPQFAQAMVNAGFEPTVMLLDSTAYEPSNYLVTADVDLPPFYLALQFWPSELAERSPATAQAIEMLRAVEDDGEYNFSYVQGLNAWILWAAAASACGSQLTVECVLEQAGTQRQWTAGGLVPPNDMSIDDHSTNPCFLIVRATPDGWVYEEEMTRPTADAFNCSPDNVAAVSGVGGSGT